MKDGGEKARKVVKVGSIIEAVFLVGLIVLLIASTLLIANTIRLSIFARRREIEVMKLVGATNWFVRGPFMIEGLLCGLIGSVGAMILLLVGKAVVLPALPNWESDNSDISALAFELTALVHPRGRAAPRRGGIGADAAPVPSRLIEATPALSLGPPRASSRFHPTEETQTHG